MADSEFNIKVGVKVDASGIQEQLNRIKGNKLQVDIDTKNANKAIRSIRKELERLARVKFELNDVGTASMSGKSGKYSSSAAQAKKDAENMNASFKELLSLQQAIKQGSQQITLLDPKKDSETIKLFKEGINDFMSQYNKLYAKVGKNLSKSQKDILNKGFNADIPGVKQTTESYKELEKVASAISKAEIKIASLDGVVNADEIKTYTNQLNSLKNTYNKLRDSLNGQLSTAQFAKLSSSAEDTVKKLELLDSKMNDSRRNAAKKIEQDLIAGNGIGGDIEKSYNDFDRKFKKLTEPTKESIAAAKRISEVKEKINKQASFVGHRTEQDQIAYEKELIANTKEYYAALKSGNNIVQENINKEKDAANAAKAGAKAEKEAASAIQLRAKANNLSLSMDVWLQKNSKAADAFGRQIRNLQMELKSCDATRLSGIQSEFKTITMQAEAAGKTGISMTDRLKMQFTRLSSYFGAASVIIAGVQILKEGFQNVLDVDTKLTELYRVTDLTSSQYSNVYDTLTASAQKYGTTLTDLISQTADWSRAGFNDPKQAAGLAEITSVYQHIADIDADTSMENILTAYKGFEPQLKKQFGSDAAAAAEHIADVYNEIDNNYATTAADIGEAVKRSASALSIAGNSLEQTAGMVTGITEVTQDPEKAGNSLKVLSMRLRGMKGELQELGEETDSNVENLSQMQGKVLNLTQGKVNIFDDAGNFKSTYEIMQSIADVYDDLTDTDKADLLETIAGKNRANEVAALIQNWNRVTQATKSAENSTGSAMEEQEKYADSLQGRLNSLSSSLQTISNNALDSGFLKGLVSGATGAVNAVNKIIETFDTIPTVVGTASIAMSAFGKGVFKTVIDETGKSKIELNDWVKNIGSSLKEVVNGFGQAFDGTFNKFNAKFRNAKENVDFNPVKFKGAFGGRSFVGTLDNDIAKLNEFKTLMKSLQDESNGRQIDVGAVIAQSMSGASNAAKDFAKSWDLSNEALGNFSKKQIEATGVISKTATSMSNAKNIISAYNNLIDGTGKTQQKFASSVSTFNPKLGNYLSGLKGAQGSLAGYGVQLGIATVKTLALEAATMAMSTALTMVIGAVVSIGINALMSWANHAQEVADKVKDIRTEYSNQKKSLRETKTTIDSVSDSYAKLSKHVDTATNKNIDLNTEEYEKYLDIVNKIGDAVPSLIKGYDDQGNAILSCAGNIDKLTEAYDKLEKKNNNKIIDNAKDTAEDAKNNAKTLKTDKMARDAEKQLEKLMKGSKNLKEDIENLDSEDRIAIANQLEDKAGINKNWTESNVSFIERALTENKQAVKDYIAEYKKDMNGASNKMRDIAEATIGNALIDGEYSNISEKMQDNVKGMISGMNFDFFNSKKINWDADKLKDYIGNMLNTFNSLDDDKQKKFEIFFDMKSKLNSGDCTVDEYIKSVDDVKSVIENSGFDKDMQYQLQMSLGIKDDDVAKNVKTLKKTLTDANISEDVVDEMVNGLTKTQLEAAVNLTVGDDSKLKDTLDKYKNAVSEYDGGYDTLAKKVEKYTEEISKINGSGIDVANGKFNNIDLNNRQELNWDDKNIKKYSAALDSWGQKAKDVKGTISTVFGASNEFDGVEIAFSPMLQTDNGAELLSKDTVYKYINGLIDKAGDGWKNEDLFRLDTKGLDIDGKHISNLLADIGDTAVETGELMHDIGNKWTADNAMKDLTSGIEKEAAYLKAMSFDINFDDEKEGIESLNSAMAEARSGAGLTKDSFDKLNSRYKSLDTYDAARLFEETANGLSLNAKAVNEYESALNEKKLKETDDSISALKEKYASLTNEIKNCSNASEKSKLIADREDVRAKISELGEMATMYEGLTSSYSKWQNAESSGNDRDMYQKIYSAQEGIKKELNNGWIDDGTEEYFKLIWGEDKWNGAGKSVEDYRNQWAQLDSTIQGTNYSISDFFTVNKDGELTSEGIFNFFDAVGQKQKELGKDWIQYDENGNMKSFNFGIDGDKAVADAMGISEELVQIFMRASQDAGFVVDFSGTYTQIADMQNEAKAAQATLNDMFKTQYAFKFDTSSLTEARESLSDAKKEFAEKGIFDLDEKGNVTAFHDTAKGAQEALQVVSTLQANVDQLNHHYIGLTVEDDSFKEPLKQLQDYESKAATLNQLKLQPQVYSGQIEELEGELDNIVKYFDGLSKEQKIKFGIDGLTPDEIESKISSGEVTIPTTLDIQTQMSGDLSTLKDIAWLNSGLLTPDQEDVIKKKLNVEWETENDTSKAEESEKKTEDELSKDSKVDKKTTVKNDVKYDNIHDKDLELTKQLKIKPEISQDDIQKSADAAMANVNLKKSGKTNFDFNFQSTNIKDLNAQISRAQALMNTFKNTDGNVDLSIEGASDAQTILQTLIEQKQSLNQPAIMNVDISTIGDENLQNAIGDMQQIQTLSNERDVKVAIGADTSDVDSKIQDVSGKLQSLINDNPDIAAKLNLNTDDVQNALNSIQGTDIEAGAKLDPDAIATIQNTLSGISPEILAKVLAGDTSDLDNLTGKATVDAKPSSTDLGGDFTGTGQVSVTPLSTALGGDFTGTGTATVTPATTFLGADFTGTGQVTTTPVNTDFGNIFTGTGIASFTPASTYLGANFSGDGKANITPASTYLGGDFTGSGEADMSAKSKFLGSDFTGTGVVTVTVNKVIGAVKDLIGGGGSKANGTAHVNGTAGNAFAKGNWGTKEDGSALMGELGQEIIVRDGHWFTVGDNGAEFVGYKKGDIVFNHKQSEELLKNGYVTSGGGRGKALAEGTAFSRGTPSRRPTYGSSNSTRGNAGGGSSSSGSRSSGSNSGSNSNANKEAEKSEQTLDWIETALNRVERAISRLDKTATSTFKNWTKRGTALNDQINQTRREIDLQNQAYNRYMQQANSVGLDGGYAAKVRDGTIDIEKITDDDLNNKISEYKQWYEKALDCLDAIDELRESESKLYEQRFENVSTKYDGYLGVIQHEKDMLDEFVSQTETAGYITSGKYYDAMSSNAKKQQEELKKQRDEMVAELNNAVNSGTIEKYSESWYNMVNSIDDVTKSIEECNTSLLEYQKNLRELDWQIFDLIQDKISKVADESEFLINLMSNKKLYEDNGQLTDEGMASMGQYGVKYNVYMAQADKYAKKIKELQADLAKDPYNQDIANQLQEYIEAQQEAILNAEDMKNSIKDMVSDGIDKELDSLQKLIDKRNDALDAAKDLYDYQKKVKEQTKDIASLEKQMAAYQGDVSEETKAKIQQIKVDLEEAKSDLEETEYEQYISDQQKMLDDLYTDYETILNQRLDDIDALMADMISEINNNASTIGATIESQADKVGYTLSESMNTIWLSGNGSISNVITMYGTKFDTALTTTNTALGYINTNIQNMIAQLNKIAGTKIKAAGASSAATEKPKPAPAPAPAPKPQQNQQPKQVTVGGMINAGGARIYADSYGNGGGRQTFGNDPIYTVLQERNGYVLTRWHKLSSGYTGWFKKSDVSAYALGAKNIRNNEMAWTQENGSEMIMRPSDGAILTPLAKNDSVLTSAASSNIWNMANNPSDFIKDNLDFDKIDTGANVGNKTTYTQNLDKVVFNLPNVKNYDELLKSMQHDKNFERLIMSMTIDPIVGKSSLAKGKAIR